MSIASAFHSKASIARKGNAYILSEKYTSSTYVNTELLVRHIGPVFTIEFGKTYSQVEFGSVSCCNLLTDDPRLVKPNRSNSVITFVKDLPIAHEPTLFIYDRRELVETMSAAELDKAERCLDVTFRLLCPGCTNLPNGNARIYLDGRDFASNPLMKVIRM